eukprot:4779397-Prymnesium_polylepis.1
MDIHAFCVSTPLLGVSAPRPLNPRFLCERSNASPGPAPVKIFKMFPREHFEDQDPPSGQNGQNSQKQSRARPHGQNGQNGSQC